jgi:hypothetical protein
MEEMRNASEVLVWKPEGKRTLARPRQRWQVGIRIYLKEIGRGSLIGLIWLKIGINGRL